MLLKVAWRNIWRNKLRSLVVMFAIALGVWAGIFASSVGNGVNKQRLENVIESQVSHMQIHDDAFTNAYEKPEIIEKGSSILGVLDLENSVEAYSSRTLLTGMISSAASGQGILIKGVVPEKEALVTGLEANLVEGAYFEGTKRNPLLMGTALAKKLNVKLRSKVVLTFQNDSSEVIRSAFRVVGLYKTPDTRNDELAVFVKQKDLNVLAGIGDKDFHEIALMVNDEAQLPSLQENILGQFDGLLVQTWQEVIPGLNMASIIAQRMNMLLLFILLTAMSFGIINTMLMAVLERVREFGMLMAVGMNKTKVFVMIMLETFFLMMIGAPLGMLISWLTVNYFEKNGLDFSEYADGFSNVGIKPIIYPFLTPEYYPKVIVLVIIAAFLAAIYPAIKAIRLRPAEAIRKL